MKRLVMLLAASLLIGAAPYGRTDSIPDTAAADKLAGARVAEAKGDEARAREEFGQAVNYYYDALRNDRQNAGLYNKLGIAQLKLGERGAARKQFAQALKYDPRLIPAINNIGVVYLLNKKYKSAIRCLKQALAMDESNAPFHVNLAEAWIGLGETDRAMTEYARALELDADVLSTSKEGIVGLVRTPEQRALVSFLIAKLYMKRGNIDGALEYLARAKEQQYRDLAKVYTDPDFAPLWKDPRLAKIVKR